MRFFLFMKEQRKITSEVSVDTHTYRPRSKIIRDRKRRDNKA